MKASVIKKNKVSKQDQYIINRVAENYGFRVRFDEDLDKWIVDGDSRYSNENFYWDSTYTIEEFFQDVKNFFMKEGEERYR